MSREIGLLVQELKHRAQHTLDVVERRKGERHELVVEPPATETRVAAVEASLGGRLPDSFRGVLLTGARKFHTVWVLPDGLDQPEEFREVFSGECFWSLDALVSLKASTDGWIEQVFPSRDDPYDVVWHDKLAFQAVGNGDYLALDLRPERLGQVVYLSHDDGEGHGLVLGSDFAKFVTTWSRLGFVGAEDWQWMAFHSEETNRLEAEGDCQDRFRKWLGIDL